ncbi:MAG TPA: cellulase family glycosylhydrolase [Anaerohalosphaeraceae bacterium]|nr:cellulase family glycosylhydrolase [Anaerohalosphaeraceae bacterium]HPB92228.1 cellulase family glycosylhydrolase [Anaerohalosphaeraceae bacterium]HRT23443.1 cellulase family glycosylhydrolase [Anaerohalosphaeraceae bacterium]
MKEKQHSEYLIRIMALLMVVTFAGIAWGYEGMATPKLHVEGRFLKDPTSKNVLLHGYMQPTATWFNGQGRWYSDPSDWTNPNKVAGMLNYLKAAATVMSDTSPKYDRDHGWYCSFVRVNTDTIGGWTPTSGLVDPVQFDAWIQNFVVPYANHLRSRGLYLVLSATGPINTPNNGTHNAGVVEQQRLITFWQTVANAPGVKNADNIMFELMNEPVDIESVPGNGDWGNHAPKYFQAFRDWIQPVINAIRDTGADNVIWVPTLEWQGSPYQHAQYPFTGSNCGIAAHFYPAYGGVFDDPVKVQSLWDRQYKPAADRWPMIITEMFWFPIPDDPWNLVNGTTAGFGNAIKRAMDNQGNVSYLCGFLGDLLDDLNDNLPANCTLSSKEGAQAYFDWLPGYTWAAPSGPPMGLSATMIIDSQVNLVWTALTNAISYNVKRSAVSGGPYTAVAADITGTAFSDTSILPGQTYYYVVSANTPSGESANSNEVMPSVVHTYLKFDETGGTTAYDATGYGWHGTLVNGPLRTSGKFGNAVSLDGVNDYISLPTGIVSGLTDFTIATWVYLNTIDNWSRVFDFGTGTGVNMFLTPRNGVTGTVRFAITTGGAGGEQQINGIAALPTGVWTHVAVTISGGAGILYINGAEVGRNNSMSLTPDSLGDTTQNYIGRSQYAADPYLNGCVDEFRIYANALDAAAISLLYAEEIPIDVPLSPTGLHVTGIAAGRIDLAWDASAGATNYNVKRSVVNGGPYDLAASVSGTGFSDTGLPEKTTFYYVVSAVNSVGQSADSPQISAATPAIPPAAPSGLMAVAGDGLVMLHWEANTESDLAGYYVYRSTTPGSGYIRLNDVLLSSPGFTDYSIACYTTYYYVVTAVDTDIFESAYSNEVEAMSFDSRAVTLSGADFEDGFGDWVNITGEDTHDWLRHSGSTPTPMTGPSGGAEGSTWYVYMRTSLGYANTAGNNAILESPVIYGFGRVLTFYYHMYGVHIGTLNVDVYDGTWHYGVWSVSGQQHISISQPYTQAIVNLSDFSGPIKIRFRAVAVGGGFGDIAIDQIEVKGRYLYGDVNRDNLVDLEDFVILIDYWLQENCELDLDGDCMISLHEFAEFSCNWLESSL